MRVLRKRTREIAFWALAEAKKSERLPFLEQNEGNEKRLLLNVSV